MPKTFTFESGALEVEIGKHARQAGGAVWIKSGKNVLLSTAVGSADEKDYIGFFPLTIEYRERPTAVGKFPGGYIKREGRLSQNEVLTSRTIDRGIRPLFPKFYFNEVQVMSSLLSSDGSFPSDVMGIIGSSLALVLSDMPFMGPIGAVKACKVDDKWLLNASHEQTSQTKDSLIVVGNLNGIMMVEGHCNSLQEAELLEVIRDAHVEIKKQVTWQNEIAAEMGITPVEHKSEFDWDGWFAKISAAMPSDLDKILSAESNLRLNHQIRTAKKAVTEQFADAVAAGEISKKQLGDLFTFALKEKAADIIGKQGKRFDGREFDQVRKITTEVGMLPCAHGSSLFTRGETQALSSITLGASGDAQKMETLLDGVKEETFMLHYNFPPYSVGEIRPLRGVGRREIGHGYLAQSSFYNVIPSQEEFTYTIRSVVDVLGSNGSSSMATVCATTLALMDAGVPLKSMLAGIAMGLLRDSDGKYIVLSDILGSEDAYGLMDFKVVGNDDGIMGFQMDIKSRDGLPEEVLEKALAAAKVGRLKILEKMREELNAPRKSVADNAPRVSSINIDTDKIGLLIGPSGKTIKDISAKTDTSIDVDDTGLVKIFAKTEEASIAAQGMIKALTGDVEIGSEYDGIIRSVVGFGIFVQIVPGKDGLVHISAVVREKQSDLANLCEVGKKLRVTVTAYDKKTGRIRLVAPSLA